MRGGMTVTAYNGHSGLRKTELGTDDMHNALVGCVEPVELNSIFAGILCKFVDLGTRQDVVYGHMLVDGRHIVVGSGNGLFRP